MNLAAKKCIPCEVGTLPLTREQAEKYLQELNSYSSSPSTNAQGKLESRSSLKVSSLRQLTDRTISKWELLDEDSRLKIRKRFKFDSYMAGVDFVNRVAKLAQGEGHHPDMLVGWRKVTINLTTHAIGGLSGNDFVMAAKINLLK